MRHFRAASKSLLIPIHLPQCHHIHSTAYALARTRAHTHNPSQAQARQSDADLDAGLASDLESVRRQERLALFRLREQAESFINHIQTILGPSRSSPSLETLLNSSSSSFSSSSSSPKRNYISTERHSVDSRSVETANVLIAHAREIQAHCRDLEAEPYKPNPMVGDDDSLVRDADSAAAPDLVAMRLEEKVRTQDVRNKLDELARRIEVMNRVRGIAAREGVDKANAYIESLGGKYVADPSPPPSPSTSPSPSPSSSSVAPATPPTSGSD